MRHTPYPTTVIYSDQWSEKSLPNSSANNAEKLTSEFCVLIYIASSFIYRDIPPLLVHKGISPTTCISDLTNQNRSYPIHLYADSKFTFPYMVQIEINGSITEDQNIHIFPPKYPKYHIYL